MVLAQTAGTIQAPTAPIPMGPAIQSTNPVTKAAEARALQEAALRTQQQIDAAKAAQAAAAAQQAQQAQQIPTYTVPQVQTFNVPQPQQNVPMNLIYTLDMMNKINTGNQAVKRVEKLNEPCADCALKDSFAQDTPQTRGVTNSKLPVPTKDENNSTHGRSSRCGTRPGNYEACIYEGDVNPGKFSFLRQWADDRKDSITGRHWTFQYENNARQDLGFSVVDDSGSFLNAPKSHMMVFPRKYLPAIHIEGNKQIVTLPNGETIIYDVKTKAIIGGVFTEQPKGNKIPVKVNYQGAGVLVRIDGQGTATDPRQTNGNATITKNGQTCKVPARSLWPDQSDRSALHFKFATDEEFDGFLKKNCKFGIN